MKYVIKPRAARKIYTFYGNVAKKYRHTYDKADYKRNVHDALMSIYNIEGTLLRREPKLKRWAKYHMAKPSMSWMLATPKTCTIEELLSVQFVESVWQREMNNQQPIAKKLPYQHNISFKFDL